VTAQLYETEFLNSCQDGTNVTMRKGLCW